MPDQDSAPEGDAREEHYRLMQSRGDQQRDHQRVIHERLTATLQLNSIITAVLIAVILVQADRAEFGVSISVPAILGVCSLIASISSAAGGLPSRKLRMLPRPTHSQQAAATMSRAEYLIWAADEMQRAYEENEAKLQRRGQWAAGALILAVTAAVLAGITAIMVIVS